MKRIPFAVITSFMAFSAMAQTPPTQKAIPPMMVTNAPATSGSISVQEMLVSGPTQLKLHSLAMITQGNVKGEIDESYLPGLTACAEDPALPLRSVAAQLLGQHFVEGKKDLNPEAVALLVQLAKDESYYVRYNAVYYGLTQIQDKTDDIILLLVDVAAKDREKGLGERIAESLKTNHQQLVGILNQKLNEGGNVAYFEIYKELTGQDPINPDKYLEMPSSVPRIFIFGGAGADPEASQEELVKDLKAAGLENPNVQVSGSGENHVLLLKTYITKDYLAVQKTFAAHTRFKITQEMWLTPEMEIQIKAMQKKM